MYELSSDTEIIFFFRTENFSYFCMVGLKKSVLLWDKTKDAVMRLLFPHISESIFSDYLTAISKGFSGSINTISLTIFQLHLLIEIAVCYSV